MADLPLISYLRRLPSLVFSSVEFRDLVVENIQDLDTPNKDGESPLFHAARGKYLKPALIMFEEARGRGVDIDFNRKNRLDVSLLQMMISSGDVELIGVFLQEGEGKIDLNTILPGSATIYEWIVFRSGLPPDTLISAVGMMIDFGFAVPIAFPSGETLVEHIILSSYFLWNTMETSDDFSEELPLVKVLESLRQLAEKEEDPRFFTETSNGLNVLHLCCSYGYKTLLEYFLRSLEEIYPELLASLLNESDDCGPAFICVNSEHEFNVLEPSSLKHCLELLVRYGQDVNCTADNWTLLHLCLFDVPMSDNQIDISVYLLEQGASLTVEGAGEISPLYLALARMQEEFLDAAIKLKAFKPNQLLGSYNSNILAILTETICADSEFGLPVCETVEKCVRLVQKLMDYGCILESITIHQIIRFYTSFPVARALFPKLLSLGVPYEQRYGQLDVVTTSVIADALSFCRVLLLDGAPLQLENRLVCCTKTPPHRRVTHSDLYGKCEFFNLEIAEQGELVCDLCSDQIQSKEGHQIATCSDFSCNMDLCASCMFFAGTEEGFTALDMATRKSNPKFISLLNFLQNSTVGKEIRECKLVELADLLLNAKIDEEPVLLNLNLEDLRTLGIIDDIGMKRLCSHLVS